MFKVISLFNSSRSISLSFRLCLFFIRYFDFFIPYMCRCFCTFVFPLIPFYCCLLFVFIFPSDVLNIKHEHKHQNERCNCIYTSCTMLLIEIRNQVCFDFEKKNQTTKSHKTQSHFRFPFKNTAFFHCCVHFCLIVHIFPVHCFRHTLSSNGFDTTATALTYTQITHMN